MQPKISLNYDSQSGDGIAGRSFHLSGLSAISRCGRTEAQDGYIRAVHLDEKDAFCLDGQRLFRIDGNSSNIPAYGAYSFRKEIDDYSTITAQFEAYQPVSFTIKTIAGDTVTYGGRGDAQVDAKTLEGSIIQAGRVNNPIISWALSKTEDRLGNYIEYQYSEGLSSGNGWQHRLEHIHYTGNDQINLDPYVKVSFQYENRFYNRKTRYVAGAAFYEGERLSNIYVSQYNQTIRHYRLNYHSFDSTDVAGVRVPHFYDRLKTVTECGRSKANNNWVTIPCLPPTYFKWDGNYLSNYRFGPHPGFTPFSSQLDDVADVAQLKDIAGTSYNPIAEIKPDLSGYPGFYGENEVLADFGERQGYETSDDDHVFFGDVNGDGLTDIVGLQRRDRSYDIKVATASINTTNNVKHQNGKVAGRYFRTDQFAQAQTLSVWGEGGDYPVTLADVDGDGRSDLVAFSELRVKIKFSQGSSFSKEFSWSHDTLNDFTHRNGWEGKHLRFLSDVNGDGRADIVGVGGADVIVALSTGTHSDQAFGVPQIWSSFFGIKDGFDYAAGDKERFELADVNGDGLPDIVAFDHDGVKVALNDPSKAKPFDHYSTWSTDIDSQYFTEETPRTVGDINGDGLADIIVFGKQGVYVSYSTGKKFTPKSIKTASFAANSSQKSSVTLPDGTKPNLWATQKITPRYVLDVNGDGHSDLVGFGYDGVYVALSSGQHIGAIKKWLAPEDYSFSAYANWSKTGTRDNPDNEAPRFIRSFGDVTGDGLPDIVGIAWHGTYVGDNFMESLRINHIVSGGYVPDSSNNEQFAGLHRSIEVEYETLTGNQGVYTQKGSNYAGYRQLPMYVVARHHDSNGEVGSNRERRATLSYTYEDFKIDRLRGVQGFKNREVYDKQTRITTRESYYQGFPHTGQSHIRKTYHGSANRVLTDSETSLKYYTLSGAEAGTRYYRVYTSETENKEYTFSDFKAFRSTSTSYSRPTSCGQINTITQKISDLSSVINKLESLYTQQTSNTYETTGDCFQQSRLKESTVTHSVRANLQYTHPLKSLLPTSNAYQSDSRTSSFEYYANGQLKKETIKSPDGNPLSTSYTYDDAGNVLTKIIEGPGGKRTATQNNFGIRREVVNTYDNQYRFLKTVTRPSRIPQVETFEYDPRFGTVTKHTDIHGVVTETRYNTFGQKYLSSPAVGGDVLTQYSWCDLEVSRRITQGGISKTYTSQARYCTTTKNQDVARSQYTKTYYDQVDRVIRVETIGAGDGGSNIIYADKVYDNYTGRLMAETRPYYRNATYKRWIEYQYDDLGRTVEVKQPDGGVNKVVYNGLITKKTNTLGQTTTERQTPRGKMAWVLDAQNNNSGSGGNQVGFIYDAVGNLIKTAVTSRDATHQDEEVHDLDKTVVTEFGYNDRNQKIWMKDPSMGHWDYSYNALGELTWQRDAKQQEVSLYYDTFGRLTLRLEKDLTTSWSYYAFGVGKQHRVYQVRVTGTNQAGTYSRLYEYNSFGQITSENEHIPGGWNVSSGQTYKTIRSYDAYGRLDRLTYPRIGQAKAVSARYQYDSRYGYLYRLVDGSTHQEHWRLLKAAADGQVTQQRLGNRVTTDREYDSMGRLDTIDSLSGTSTLQSLEYDFDKAGNLKQRQDTSRSLEENFHYDKLNRLIRTDTTYLWLARTGVTATTSRSNRYDGHGNLRYQDDIRNIYGKNNRYGSYTAYQVGEQQRNGNYHGSTVYDANGNVTRHHSKQLRLHWNSFNKPWATERALGRLTFLAYGDKHQRIMKDARHALTWYVDGGHYERYQLKQAVNRQEGNRPASELNSEQHRYHLMVNGQRVGTLTQYLNNTGQWVSSQKRYFLTDHLGSTDVVVDEQGQRLHQLSYTSWGERRKDTWNPDGLMGYGGSITNSSLISLMENLEAHAVAQGFTGHEHDDQMGLINMKGRLYDPQLGRFMSPDPHIQAPNNIQNYNRYTYVLNNPLSYTDPSGYFFKKAFQFIEKNIRTAVAIASIFVAPNIAAAVIFNAVTSAAITYTETGSLSAAATAGFISGVTTGLSAGLAGVAKAVTDPGLGRLIAHGVAQGSVSVLQGGKFRDGFVSAFAGHAARNLGTELGFGDLGTEQGKTARTVIAATVGGLVSEATGGKFANGAVTAAFVHLYNAEQPTKAEQLINELGFTEEGPGLKSFCLMSSMFYCGSAYQASGEAHDAMRNAYPTFFNVGDNPPDAFRHAYWSMTIAQRTNYNFAIGVTDAYERSNLGKTLSTAMDLYNNRVGISLGLAYPNAVDMNSRTTIIKTAINNGQIIRSLWDSRLR